MGLEAAAGVLACPRCGGALRIEPHRARCAEGHSYDRARQGYLNLLGHAQPANADTPDMLRARQRVLGSGLFDRVAELVASHTRGRTVLEVGAGTGHYLLAALGDDPERRGIALDVSTAAARLAARADERVAAVVADVWQRLPLLEDSVDTVLAVFAPRNLPEFARVLAPGGHLIVVSPGEGHLAELRDRHGLLGIEPDKATRLLAAAGEFFDLRFTGTVSLARTIPGHLVGDLIAMGPNAHHRAVAEPPAAGVRIEVVTRVFTPLVSGSSGEEWAP